MAQPDERRPICRPRLSVGASIPERRRTIDGMSEPEVWLRGPVAGVPPHLQPVAHGLLQCREEIARVLADMTPGQIWYEHANAASIGFHVLHAIGSLDRLFT